MAHKPNILIVQADQLTALCLAAYGKPLALTPNIDKIALQGTVFTNTYCNSPVCGPSRAGMMTGRLPSNVGVFDNAGEFLSSEPTLRIIFGLLAIRRRYAARCILLDQTSYTVLNGG